MNDLLEGIEVEEECHNCGGDGSFYNQGMLHARIKCDRCKGTGKIRRPATFEDIDLKDLINHYNYPCDKDHAPKTPTGGKLMVKH